MKYTRFWLGTNSIRKHGSDYTIAKKGICSIRDLYRLKTSSLTNSQLYGKEIQITDSFWHLHSLQEIFVEEVYKFKSASESPYILDCGANIGLSAIYFKHLYPRAQIIAFEPDRATYDKLRFNTTQFGYDDIKLENIAVWKEDTTLEFLVNGGLGGKLYEGGADTQGVNARVQVEARRLRNFLNKKVDFLKIDIEGAEVEVLNDCKDQLSHVVNLFVEYHSSPAHPQQLDELLSILKAAGFRVYIREAWNNLPYPYLRHIYNPYYDLQLNIFAYKDQQ